MAYDALPLDILPGIFKEASEYASQGRYVDGNNVRFWKGFAERIGGNDTVADERLWRPARGMVGWRALTNSQLMAFGHARGCHVLQGGNLYDVSPTGTSGFSTLTIGVGAITAGPYQTGETVTTANGATGTLIQASAASPLYVSGDNGTLRINIAAITGSFLQGEPITFSGGGSARIHTGGSSTPVTAYDYTGTLTGTITGSVSLATATVSSTAVHWTGTITGGTSGATATISSVSETWPTDSDVTTAYGEGTYGSGVWGGSESLFSSVAHALNWTFGLWGEDLIACPRGGKIYALDTSTFLGATTTNLALISGTPSNALGVFMSDANRTLIAYGAHDGSVDDFLNIRWCDEEDYTTWTASAANTAGSIRCESGSLIVGHMKARESFLISTDTTIYLFRYVGLPFVFSLTQIASGGTLVGPHAWAEQDGITYWMGENGFYTYDGAVSPISCDVHSYVFGRINAAQGFKVSCGSNRAYNEIWWFYASSDSTEIDSYVVFNTVERTWSIGDKSRTSWLDTNVVFNYPTGTKADGSINIEDYNTTDQGTAIDYSLSTSDVEIADGTNFLHGRKIIVDFDRISGSHDISVECRGWPARAPTTKGPYALTSATEELSIRARGRTMRFVLEGSDDFRMGRMRVRLTGHGKRP